jgi:drug/metabolite transporter (DMT)-like permease
MKPKQLAMLGALAGIWGASFLLIRLAVATAEHPSNFPPYTLVGVRIGLAAIILYGLLKMRGGAFAWHAAWPLAVLGLINAALPYFLFAWGEQFIPSNLAAIYNATTPLFTVLLALLVVREERLSAIRSLGVLIGFGGIVYLFADGLGTIGDAQRIWGELACVVAAFCYGVGNMRGLQPMQLATGQMVFGTLWTLPPIVLIEQPWRTLAPTPTAIAALLALSILGTALAMVLYFGLLTQVGATRTAQVTYLLPIFGLFWGWLAGETITSRVIGALVIVLIGMAIVNGGVDRLWRRWVVRKPEVAA